MISNETAALVAVPQARPRRGLVLLLALVALTAAATVLAGGRLLAGGGTLTVEDAWVRPVAAGQVGAGNAATSAIYLTIHNTTNRDDTLLHVETSAARAAEIHRSSMEHSVMRMHAVEGVTVPAGGQVILKPGDVHIMLVGVQQPLAIGDRVPVTLHFEHAGTVTVEATVRQPQ